MFCKECGKKHPVYSNYCPNDGHDMQPVFASQVEHRSAGFCANCGKSVDPTSQYCQHCGESHSTMKLGTVKKLTASPEQSKSFALPNLATSRKTMITALMAVGLTILLTIIASFVIKSQAENFIIKSSEGEVTQADFKEMNYLSESLQEQTGLTMDFPNVYNLFTYISLMHSINFNLLGDINANDFGDRYQETLDIEFKNMSLSLLPITILILILGGLILGYLVKKNQSALGRSLLLFSTGYGLFLVISSLIASFTIKEGLEFFSTEMDIVVKGVFPVFESFIVGFLLASAFSGLAALAMMYGKDVFTFMRTQASHLQYLVYSLVISIVGLTAFSIIYFIASGKHLREDLLLPDQATALGAVLSGPGGMWLWNLSHLIPLNFTSKEDGDTEFFSLHLFNSYEKLSNLDGFSTVSGMINDLLFVEESIPFLLKASLLIPALLLIIAGFLLYRTHSINPMELIKFSLIYGFIMILIGIFSKISLSIDMTGGENIFDLGQFFIQIQPNLIPSFIISAIFALVCFSIGGYLKHYLGEPAK